MSIIKNLDNDYIVEQLIDLSYFKYLKKEEVKSRKTLLKECLLLEQIESFTLNEEGFVTTLTKRLFQNTFSQLQQINTFDFPEKIQEMLAKEGVNIKINNTIKETNGAISLELNKAHFTLLSSDEKLKKEEIGAIVTKRFAGFLQTALKDAHSSERIYGICCNENEFFILLTKDLFIFFMELAIPFQDKPYQI